MRRADKLYHLHVPTVLKSGELILAINQLNAQILVLIISLLYASTCFEHYVLIIRWSKLYYTASGIITPVGGRPVHKWREVLYNTILTS